VAFEDSHHAAIGQAPQPEGVVCRARQHRAAVRGDGYDPDPAVVPFEGPQAMPGPGVPHLQGAVLGRGDQQPAAGDLGEAPDEVGVPGRSVVLGWPAKRPHAHGTVDAAGDHQVRRAGERQHVHRIGMPN
jgi:hypothetical protein